MGIGRILHTHKSFLYCWCERIIHKVRTVFQTYGFHHTLHTHFFFTDCQYQTRYILEDGCMSIELVRVLVRVLVWVSFSSSLYPISIYRFFSSLFSPSSKLRKNFTRYNLRDTKFWWWHVKRYAVARQRRELSSFRPSRHALRSCPVLSCQSAQTDAEQ